MDSTTPLVVWILLVSGLTTGALLAVVGVVFAWHQKRIASEAQRWGQHVLAAQDAERQRIARDLHDDLVHRVQAAQSAIGKGAIEDCVIMLDRIAGDMRSLAHDLHPPALEHFDLPKALHDLRERRAAWDGPEITVITPEEAMLPGPAAVAIYRVAQEGLANAMKHARAATVRIELRKQPNSLTLTVTDDGVGIPEAKLGGGSFGLRSMRERLTAVGGTLDIRAVSPQGTFLVATVPV